MKESNDAVVEALWQDLEGHVWATASDERVERVQELLTRLRGDELEKATDDERSHVGAQGADQTEVDSALLTILNGHLGGLREDDRVDVVIDTLIRAVDLEGYLVDSEKLVGHLFLVHGVAPGSASVDDLEAMHERLHMDAPE